MAYVDMIDKETWVSMRADVKGAAYEGLLEKNAYDTPSGACNNPGQSHFSFVRFCAEPGQVTLTP